MVIRFNPITTLLCRLAAWYLDRIGAKAEAKVDKMMLDAGYTKVAFEDEDEFTGDLADFIKQIEDDNDCDCPMCQARNTTSGHPWN